MSRNMDIAQMVDIICTGNPARKTVNVKIREGMEVEDIAELLVEEGILDSTRGVPEPLQKRRGVLRIQLCEQHFAECG